MRILVTNDDGWRAEGIQVLARELSSLGDVTLVAPEQERSATGHAITVHKPLRVDEVHLSVKGPVAAYAVNGTPSDCVKLAVQAVLSETPDIVVSGINRGPNLGTDVLYSGTVSGAMEGIILGIPAVAVSLATTDPGADYVPAARFIIRMVRQIASRGLMQNTLLNVNFPWEGQPPRGVRITRLGTRKWQDVFERRTDPRGKAYYWMAGAALDTDEDPEADTVAVRENFISVTPISFDLTNSAAIPEVSRWNLVYEDASKE